MTPSAALREKLAAGPTRGLGCADQVAQEAVVDPGLREELADALEDARPRVVARAANALKKVQAQDPRALDVLAPRLVRFALVCQVLEARWNLFVILGGLPLYGTEKALAVELLFTALNATSALTRTCAMQALVDLSQRDPALRKRLRPVLESAVAQGTAAMRARARRLLPALGKDPG